MSKWVLASSSLDSGAARSSQSTTTARGTLIQNARRQSMPTSQPPTRGPAAVAMPSIPVHAPMAFIRSSLRKEACSMASDPGVRRAAATP